MKKEGGEKQLVLNNFLIQQTPSEIVWRAGNILCYRHNYSSWLSRIGVAVIGILADSSKAR